jgi:hypothetical protein
MKKVLFLAVAVSFALATTSCNKERTCACNAAGIFPAQNFPLEKASKSDQEAACEAIDATRKLASADASCTLK